MSIRIPSKTVEIDGHQYTLRCSMSVLERLQDDQDGSIGALLKKPSYQSVFLILKAMLDDYCEDEDVPEVPLKRLKKLYSPADVSDLGVFRMFVASLSVTADSPDRANVSGSGAAETQEDPGHPGN